MRVLAVTNDHSMQYRNGKNFGRSYTFQHGINALVRDIRRNVLCLGKQTCADYVAGEIDIALMIASTVEARDMQKRGLV